MPMTNQEIFDTVARHLFTQGVRSANGNKCLYRGPDGTKCAVGCLIPDSVYSDDFEGTRVRALVYGYPEVAQLFATDSNGFFLNDLQSVHDCQSNWKTTSKMRDALRVAVDRSNAPIDASILDTLSFADR